jgi:tryptophan-rich sensory protein
LILPFEVKYGPYGVAGGLAFLALGAGGVLTEIGPWYRGLRKPSWQPPDWLFGPAWTLIFIGVGWSAGLSWKVAPNDGWRWAIGAAFGVNLVLNIIWSLLFFKLRRPDWALVEVVPLWLSILLLMVLIGCISGFGAALLAPYLAWVAFAAYLNRTIVRLNPRRA